MGLTKKVKNYFTSRIKNIVRTTGYSIPYFPYDKGASDYIIPKAEVSYPKCEQGLPIPPFELSAGYGFDQAIYLKYGKMDIDNMMDILKSASFEINGRKKILDFGCSSGRMVRWLKPYSDNNEIWGTDISADHIYWANKYLNPPFHFAVNTTFAHMPFEDKYFDLIYSGSVFTHIDNLNETWLLEMRRILSEKGFFYVTIHDNDTLRIINEKKNMGIYHYLKKHPLSSKLNSEFDMFVLNRVKSSPQVFFDKDYFEKLINPIFDIVSRNPGSYEEYQTGYLLKRKSV